MKNENSIIPHFFEEITINNEVLMMGQKYTGKVPV